MELLLNATLIKGRRSDWYIGQLPRHKSINEIKDLPVERGSDSICVPDGCGATTHRQRAEFVGGTDRRSDRSGGSHDAARRNCSWVLRRKLSSREKAQNSQKQRPPLPGPLLLRRRGRKISWHCAPINMSLLKEFATSAKVNQRGESRHSICVVVLPAFDLVCAFL
jgi:hypothetical protein